MGSNLQKANCLAGKFSQLYQEEMSLRSTFQAKLKKHFLSKMFPGMEDVPPAFATVHPDGELVYSFEVSSAQPTSWEA